MILGDDNYSIKLNNYQKLMELCIRQGRGEQFDIKYGQTVLQSLS